MPLSKRILNRIEKCVDGKINLSNLNIKDADLPLIISELKKQSSLSNLDLSKNKITDKGAELLAILPLRVLDIYYNYITDIGFSALLGNTALYWLNAAQNGLTNACALVILQNERLLYVNLESNVDITIEMLKKIKEHINDNGIKKNRQPENKDSSQKSVSSIKLDTLSLKDELKEKAANDKVKSASSIKLFPPAPKDERKEKAANDTTEMKSPTNKNS